LRKFPRIEPRERDRTCVDETDAAVSASDIRVPASPSEPTGPGTDAGRTVDFDLHGIVGIRLVDPAPEDVTAVTWQLGPIQSRLDREPDIKIRFVERISLGSRIRFIGLQDMGFTDDAFVVVGRSTPIRARASVPVQQIGEGCEITCQTGIGAVPFLTMVVNLTALNNGYTPVHASAFGYRGTGGLAAGWAKGGKTEALLGFMANGATYIGDEWVYVNSAGNAMYGIPEPIRIWDWHLSDLPGVRARVPRKTRTRFHAIKLASLLERSIARRLDLPPSAAVRRLAILMERQLWVRIPPDELFGSSACSRSSDLDVVFLVVSHESPETVVEVADAHDVAHRMTFSFLHEHADLQELYLKWRFAFPKSPNTTLDNLEDIAKNTLTEAIAHKPAYAVYHPFPPSISALYETMEPLFR
jgi:hypothetical protein